MSDKEYDWNDDLDFESLADEADLGAGYADGDASFAELGDLADYADSPEDDLTAPPAVDAEEPAAVLDDTATADQSAAAAAPASGFHGQALSAGGLGFLTAATSLVAALGAAGALFFVSGMDPALLVDFSGVLAVDQILDFQAYPQNLVYLVVLGVVVLSALSAAVVGRVARQANRRVQQSENLLDRVTALRLDEEEPWSADLFKTHPDTAAFVSDVLGAWRLLQARQVKSVALEGEMRRLEKALRSGNRTDLADRYDHPLVGSVADGLVRMHDERETARQEAAAVQDKDAVDSAEIMTLIQDACSWNRANRQGVEVQSSTLKRWADKFTTLAREHQDNPATREAAAGLQGLQRDLNRELEASAAGGISLDDLVDRGSKLAFQIAMEVARLGPRGERLLPMSQSLEELTTQFRQAVSGGKGDDESVVSPQAMLTRLEQISVSLSREGASGAAGLARTLEDLAPAALKVAGNLDGVVEAFQQQDTRLDKLGGSFGELARIDFDPAAVPDQAPSNPPEGGLGLTQNDPFGKEQAREEEPPSLEVDPFGDAGGSQAKPASPLADSPLAGGPLEAENQESGSDLENDPFASGEPVESDGGLQVEQFGFGEPLETPSTEVEEFQVQSAADELSAEPALSREEEKVYDLEEFGARRIDTEDGPSSAAPGQGEDEERIYDLAEFGAVALN